MTAPLDSSEFTRGSTKSNGTRDFLRSYPRKLAGALNRNVVPRAHRCMRTYAIEDAKAFPIFWEALVFTSVDALPIIWFTRWWRNRPWYSMSSRTMTREIHETFRASWTSRRLADAERRGQCANSCSETVNELTSSVIATPQNRRI